MRARVSPNAAYPSLSHSLTLAECAVKSITYPLKWAFVELLPVFAVIALLVVYGVLYLYKRMCLNIPSEKRHAHLSQLIACVIVSEYGDCVICHAELRSGSCCSSFAGVFATRLVTKPFSLLLQWSACSTFT